MIYADRTLGLVQNVFGEWVDPHERRSAPCRSIPLTAEMRNFDAAKNAARTAVSDWKIKSSLSEANLGIVRQTLKPKQIVAPPPPKPAGPRRCACGRKLAKDNYRETCYLCRWHKKCRAERRARRVKCDTVGCRGLLRFGRTSGLCKRCANKLRHPEVKRRYRARKKAKLMCAAIPVDSQGSTFSTAPTQSC